MGDVQVEAVHEKFVSIAAQLAGNAANAVAGELQRCTGMSAGFIW
jgi:hypothetical protein